MKTKIVIESVDELFKLFNNNRIIEDKFPFVGNDKLNLRFSFRIKELDFSGEDSDKYELVLKDKDDFENVIRRAFDKLNIPIDFWNY